MTVIEKLWGREEIIASTGRYAGKRMVLDPGASCSWHVHLEKDETFHVVSGEMTLEYSRHDTPDGADRVVLRPGHSFRVEPGVRHRFTGGPLGCVFYEFSSADSPEDSVRFVPSRSGPPFRVCGECGRTGEFARCRACRGSGVVAGCGT